MKTLLLDPVTNEKASFLADATPISTYEQIYEELYSLLLCTSSFLMESAEAPSYYEALQLRHIDAVLALMISPTFTFSYEAHTTVLSFLRFMDGLLLTKTQLLQLTNEETLAEAIQKIFSNAPLKAVFIQDDHHVYFYDHRNLDQPKRLSQKDILFQLSQYE
ncbi:hypothetical protein MM326_00435 [Alkalihalobacillus sp. LMS6]|uniref:hypothetical protein n=1 Tax=Alkalihalobacillus sp. LMS6 TaxID=2924034 RepID=UPI0020D12C35|nr:hypothetical protein [Alkalihalobacillus sp. LMS6]UTR06563.1 hypothetical protein MM326_00435 [Alkalihalobacillus sp. LMS6]